MKRIVCFLVCAMLAGSCALAEQQVKLPNSRYVIDVPDWMRFKEDEQYPEIHAYTSEMMEIDYTSYPREAALAQDPTGSLRKTAEALAAAGGEAELREINGIEMICFRTVDDADGAPCIGYVFEDEGWMIEVDFWYATQEAANLTETIISSIRPE